MFRDKIWPIETEGILKNCFQMFLKWQMQQFNDQQIQTPLLFSLRFKLCNFIYLDSWIAVKQKSTYSRKWILILIQRQISVHLDFKQVIFLQIHQLEISRDFIPPVSHGEKCEKFRFFVKIAHKAVILILLSL